MKISGFTFLRNGSKLFYPIIESIQSALPLVDEFVIALGDSDPDDDTREKIEALGSDKIRIIDTVWDLEKYPRGMEHAHQTDIAKNACTGDWLLYLQGDEVLHEDDLPIIRQSCENWLNDKRVDGMLFDYLHFWGDYDHVHCSHAWYKEEIRLIRNDPEIHSFRSAQSFRRIPNFDGVSYREKKGTKKLHCVHSGARIFHYGWVRPPIAMRKKTVYFTRNHRGEAASSSLAQSTPKDYDYGPLAPIPTYQATHPRVMSDTIRSLDWQSSLYFKETDAPETREQHKHERFKYVVLSWIENRWLKGRQLFASENYHPLEKFKHRPHPALTLSSVASENSSS
ncbi:conserved hypothetical protein [gamma proteobacterium HTCC5015]|nr:conserved hypothetical protein [gamma proteobacterium HTCC5015]